jgi:hypothetical protein
MSVYIRLFCQDFEINNCLKTNDLFGFLPKSLPSYLLAMPVPRAPAFEHTDLRGDAFLPCIEVAKDAESEVWGGE